MLQLINIARQYSGLIIVGLFCLALWGLNTRNAQLSATNLRLEAKVTEGEKEKERINSKNDDLANTLQNLTDKIGQANTIASTEARRRAAAEMKNNRLQEEVKGALKDNKCSNDVIPDAVISRLLEQANRIRIGKDADYSDSGKSDK